jgi:outer membrane protein OmpA-like peptidoglycan-associated protein
MKPWIAMPALAAWIAACASSPNADLVRAEEAYRAAESDPLVAENAPVPLEDAKEALERAQRAYRSGEDEDEVDHLAYVARRRVEIAEAAAERKLAAVRAEELAASEAARGLSPRPTPGIAVEAVFFDPERSELRSDARIDVARVADRIRALAVRPVEIEGHADSSEPDAADLSEVRAQEVREALVEDGVDPELISVRGLGASAPVASNVTAEGRSLNRRVEILYRLPTTGSVH